ncbi:MAG: DNA-processing protein DprA [Clostridiaceae bacterium]
MNRYELWLNSSKLCCNTIDKLLDKFQDEKNLWEYSIKNNNKDRIINNRTQTILERTWNADKFENLESFLKTSEIKFITYKEELFPRRLKNIKDMPYSLFYLGDIETLNKFTCVSVVGARNNSIYGENVSKLIAKELVKNNINVISGMARGIDSFSHIGTLNNNGFTCAILGSGIDIIYPYENKNLYHKIAEKGCVISEFPLGTKPLATNFPQRNRIISGLSDLVIVVEAKFRSGSLNTANHGGDQSRTVMAVVGSILSPLSFGCHEAIRNGAKPIYCMEDIFEELKMDYSNGNISNTFNDFNKEQEKIYSILSDYPLHIDELYRKSHIDIKELYGVLFELQMKNEIECIKGNYYKRKTS